MLQETTLSLLILKVYNIGHLQSALLLMILRYQVILMMTIDHEEITEVVGAVLLSKNNPTYGEEASADEQIFQRVAYHVSYQISVKGYFGYCIASQVIANFPEKYIGAKDFILLAKVAGYKHPTMSMLCWKNSEKKALDGLISTNNYNQSKLHHAYFTYAHKKYYPKITFPKDVVITLDNPSTKSMDTEITKASSTRNQ
jgi:hypothetical protein